MIVLKNTDNYVVGQEITLPDNYKVSIKFNYKTRSIWCHFVEGQPNFKTLPEFYKAKIVYIAESGKYAAVSVCVDGNSDSVIAFFLRNEGQEKNQIVDIPTNQKVYPVTKDDGSVFYFFKPGWCNFIIAPDRSHIHNDGHAWSALESERGWNEGYYEELGNSVCEYCGDYHCDCQRSLDENWGW